MKNRSLNSQEGITLIALIVTAIVLLILSGITISAITGDNGIINETKSATKDWGKADEKDRIDLSVINSMGRSMVLNYDKFNSELSKYFDDYTLVKDGDNFKLTLNGTEYTLNEEGHIIKEVLVGSVDDGDTNNGTTGGTTEGTTNLITFIVDDVAYTVDFDEVSYAPSMSALLGICIENGTLPITCECGKLFFMSTDTGTHCELCCTEFNLYTQSGESIYTRVEPYPGTFVVVINKNTTDNPGDIIVTMFTILFLVNGIQYFKKEETNTIDFPETDPTMQNKEFTGWYYDEACTDMARGGDIITEDTTLYAGWKDISDSGESSAKVEAITNKNNGAEVACYNKFSFTYQTTKEIASCTIVEMDDEAYKDLYGYGAEREEEISVDLNLSFVKNSSNSKNADITTPTVSSAGYKRIYMKIRIDFTDGTYDTDEFLMNLCLSCFVSGTKIKLKDRTEKEIENITYEDELLVWDFDNGCLASAKPLWIKKKETTFEYNWLRFENGLELKTIQQHRIFNKEAGKFTYPMTDETPIGTTVVLSDGTETKLVSKEVVKEKVDFYNIITDYHINLFANDILTSCRLSNLYEIKDMKYVKDGRELVTREEYKNIPDKYYYGLRLAEQPREINRGNDDNHGNTVEEYVEKLIRNEKES